jgi:membrane AbrB-like protein
MIAMAVAYAFMKLRIPNAWLLGPLMVSLLLTLNGQSMSAVPQPLAVAAQLLLGCSLGARFNPGFRTGSRRLLVGVLASIFVTVSLSALLGVLMAWLMGMSGAMLVLATAPGGLSEMCITAKVLKLGVPLVTSFQVARLVFVVTMSLPIWRMMQAAKRRFSPAVDV